MNVMVKTHIKNQLATNPAWALRALVKLYERQTADEQATGHTANLNGIGFSGVDSEILSSFAVQVNNGKNLSAKQMAIVFKKMPRYHRQVLSFIPAEKLEEIKNNLAVKA